MRLFQMMLLGLVAGMPLALPVPGHAQAQAVDIATVSMTDPNTAKLVNNAICYTDGRDLACDRGASLLTGGLISTTSLTVGGQNLQQIIASGTSGVTPAGPNRAIQFNNNGTLGGTGAAQIDPTGHIITSGTNIYAGGNYGYGYVGMFPSNDYHSGYVGFHAADNSRTGFIGYADASWLHLNSEGGRNLRFHPGAGLVHVSGSVDVAGVIRGQVGAGQGDVLLIGNDTKLVDINALNMSGLYGQQDAAVGGLMLGASGTYLWGANGNMGIGRTNPAAKLDVNGEVRVGSTSLACGGTTAGAIQYSGGTLQYCNGTSYVPLAGSGSLGNYVAKTGDTMSGELGINNSAPTIRFQDTDNRSGFLHVNSDFMYFLGGTTNAGTWTMNGSYWPLTLNLQNDEATFGGNVVIGEGNLSIYNNGNPVLHMSKSNGGLAYTRLMTGGVVRWDYGADSGNETGGNSGSDFFINRFSDTGIYINSPFVIRRSSGNIELNGPIFSNGSTIWHAGNDGSGSGLDADTLDGLHASSFIQAGAETDPQVGNTNAGNACIGTGTAVDCGPSNVGDKDDITTRTASGFWQTSTPTVGEGWPATIGGWVHLLTSTHSNAGNYFSMQFAGDFYDATKIFYRVTNGDGTAAWHKLWHSGNDGSGSGLDADTLDGADSSAFLRFGQTYTGDNVLNIRGSVATNDVWSGGLEIQEVNGVGNTQLGPEYAPAITFHWQGAAASSIKMYADTSIRFRDQSSNPNGYRDIYTKELYARDVHADRGDGTGVIYLNNAGNRYVHYDGTNYQMPGANLFVNGSQVATAAGLANYVAKAGDTMTGTLTAPNIAVGAGWDYAGTEIRSYQTGFPYIDFSLNSSEDFRFRQLVDRSDGGLRFQGADGITKLALYQNGNLSLGSTIIQADGNIYMPYLGGWLSAYLNQDVRHSANPTFGTVYAPNWFRSSGDTGWFSETHGGGWYMTDSTWIRAYNGKSIYTPAILTADSQVRTGNLCDTGGGNCSTPASIAAAAAAAANKVSKAGDTMSGNLTVNANLNVSAIGYFNRVQALSNVAGGNVLDARAVNGGGTAFLGINTAWGYYCYIAHYDGYAIICGGPTSGVSDGRLKTDVTPLKPSEGLDAIMALKPVHYRWKESTDKRSEFGFIAQDVEKVLPGLVGEVEQNSPTTKIHLPGGRQKVLNYERIIAPTVLAVQQLKAENDELKAANDNLRAIVEKQGRDIEALKAAIR